MAAAIRALMDAPDLRARIVDGALKLAQDWFSWDIVIKRSLATFDGLRKS
jgi:glycosyltransferase involved in cell wall biosynthesis